MKASFLRLVIAGSGVLFAGSALAQGGSFPRDASMLKSIDVAINTHYLATDFDTAEKLLHAAIRDCRNQCSTQVLAKAWSYLGILAMTGSNDRARATDAFTRAFALDPNLKVDFALATPEVNELLRTIGGSHATSAESSTNVESPPSYPEAAPKARYAEKQECPPDFPGCTNEKVGGDTDWGGGCDNSAQCKTGLLCIDGTCEPPPSCRTDDDCSVGRCVETKCSVVGNEDGPSRKRNENWLGLHLAQDFAAVTGTDVCAQATQAANHWSCYYAGSSSAPYQNDPHPGVKIGGGFAKATTRVLLSYDRVLFSRVTAGLRIGFAFGGGPPSGRQVDYGGNPPLVRTELAKGSAFFPIHLEARVTYWFGRDPFHGRFRPYVHLGGGMAQIDVRFEIPTRDCGPNSTSRECLQNSIGGQRVELEAWKRLGLEFIALGGGFAYEFVDWLALDANLNLLYPFPSSAPVLQPSIGVLSGF